MGNTNTIDLSKSLEELYLKNDLEQVKKLLLQNKESFDPGVFHYNLGTLYTKMNDPATGRYHLERAIKEGLWESKVFHNLNVVKTTLQVSDISSSESILDKSINYSMLVPSQLYFSLTFLFAISILLMARTKVIRKISLISVLLVFSLLPLAFKELYLNKLNFAIVMKDAVLREGPSEIYAETQKMKAGAKIVVSDVNNGWFFIKAPNFYNGWIHRDSLGLY